MNRVSMWVVSCSVLLSCGPVPEADKEACEHLAESKSESITAGKTLSEAPVIKDDHKRTEVTLPSDKSKAFVRFNADEDGEYIFFVDKTLSVELKNSKGEAAKFEKTERSSPACGTIKGKYTADLKPGTYFLELGPEGSNWSEKVNVLVEHADH